MERSSKREIGAIGALFVLVGGWFFGAGFERPWTIGHMSTLLMLLAGIAICVYALLRR